MVAADIMSHCCECIAWPIPHFIVPALSLTSLRIFRTDATAGFSTVAKDAAAQLIWPIIVEEVMTVEEWIASLKGESLKREGEVIKSKV
jgi:hypothetical protein